MLLTKLTKHSIRTSNYRGAYRLVSEGNELNTLGGYHG